MAKKNTNVLEGFICPNPGCGHTAKFNITCTVNVDFTDDGEEDHGGFEWEDTSECVCSECGHSATVKDFRAPEEDEEDSK